MKSFEFSRRGILLHEQVGPLGPQMHNKFFPSRRVAALHIIVELMMCFFSAARERAQTRERASYEKPTRGQ